MALNNGACPVHRKQCVLVNELHHLIGGNQCTQGMAPFTAPHGHLRVRDSITADSPTHNRHHTHTPLVIRHLFFFCPPSICDILENRILAALHVANVVGRWERGDQERQSMFGSFKEQNADTYLPETISYAHSNPHIPPPQVTESIFERAAYSLLGTVQSAVLPLEA